VTSPSSVDTSPEAVERLAELLARHAVGGNVLDTAADTLRALQSQLEAATRDAEQFLGELDEITAALPGVWYMSPPDGGDVSVAEQVRRMAKDAARYRWLRQWYVVAGEPRSGTHDIRVVHGYDDVLTEEELDAAVDADRAGES
jgi:uncharacterized protein YoaH (UPF0181 family)